MLSDIYTTHTVVYIWSHYIEECMLTYDIIVLSMVLSWLKGRVMPVKLFYFPAAFASGSSC